MADNEDAGTGRDVGQQGAQGAQQIAEQAVQAARQASQQAEQAVQAAQQAARAVGGEASAASLGATIETDISPASITDAWRSNLKRSYDEYQHESLAGIRLARRTAEQLAAAHTDLVRHLNTEIVRGHRNAQSHDENAQKQFLEAEALKTDRIWNIDEVAARVVASQAFQDAMTNLTAQVVAKQGQKPGTGG